MIDYHIHSSFSTDSSMQMQTACEKAIMLGLSEIAFTDHIDIDYPDNNYIFDLDIDLYLNNINKMQHKFKNKLIIKKGIEIGLQPHVLKTTNNRISKADFDFIIASIHGVHQQDLHNGDFFKSRTDKQAYMDYLNEFIYILKNYDNYDVIGHLDIIRRYSHSKASLYDIEECIPLIDELLTIIIQKNKCIEINTSSFRYGVKSTMPDINILKRYKELGGRLITLGSDAHSTEYIAYKFDYVYNILNKLGFKYLTYYYKRKPIIKQI